MGPFDRNIRVTGKHLALKRFQACGNTSTDLADTDDSGNFVFQFMSGKGGPLPFARFEAVVGGWNIAAECKEQRHGMFCGAVGVAEWGVDNNHPF